MGLDMYLNKYPRYKNTTAREVEAVESYLDWLKAKERESEYANCSFSEWCGAEVASKLPSSDIIAFYQQFYTEKYYAWDVTRMQTYTMINDNIAYWRKANAIHQWFVDHVQDGEDDCDYHREVTKEDLERLRDTCIEVLTKSVMMLGQVKNGASLIDGQWVDNMELGKVIINPEVAEELLPTQGGFFFGGTDYDEWYIKDLQYTVNTINQILATTDFDKEMIYYRSSW